MIRKAQKEDEDFFYDLYMHPQINPYLLYEPISKEEFTPIFEDLFLKNALFVYQNTVSKIGMFKLIQFDYRTSHINYLGGIAINPDFAGQGFGKKMLLEIIDYVKNLGIKRLELAVSIFNEKAIKLYESVGFEREGLMRKAVYLQKEDKYVDELMMSMVWD